MVTFQHLKTAIQANPHASLQVLAHRIQPQPIVERFKLPTIRIESAVIPKPKVEVRKRPASPTSSHSSVSDLAPPPMRIMTLGTLKEPREPLREAREPLREAREPLREAREPLREAREPVRGPRELREPRGRPIDPLCIGIERQDSMYAIANANTKQQLECYEARRLEAQIATLYKEESGRSRGWVKTKLEAYFLPRAAVGSRVNAKDAFDWSKIWEKEVSAILDYICISKGIRLAVWRDADRIVGLWPAADKDPNAHWYHISSTGVLLNDERRRNILQSGYRIVAPYSVEHALEKLSQDELDTVAEKLGISGLPTKKSEKVRALASARMRLRIRID